MQDKELNRRFSDFSARLDRIENAKPGEVVVGSALDTKLTKLSDAVSEIKNSLTGLTERVDSHIKFFWRSVTALGAILLSFAGVLYTQNGRISRLEGISPSVQLEKSTSGRLNPPNVKKAQSIVADARRTGRDIDPAVIRQVGLRLVAASESKNQNLSIASWETVQEFVNYRSFLNSNLVPDTNTFVQLWSDCRVANRDTNTTTYVCHWSTGDWRFDLHPVAYQYLPMSLYYKVGRTVIAKRAAVLERLDHPLNAGQNAGPEFLLMDAGGTVSQTLDGYRFKNVIFRGVKILYRGGPVEMENVYFVNCTFQAINEPNARELLMAALEPAPITFKKLS